MREFIKYSLLVIFILALMLNIFLNYSIAYDRGYSAALDSVLVSLKKTSESQKKDTWDTITVKNKKWQIQKK